jgi:hypothetical protein
MDNRINEIRCKINALRGEMARVEETMRDQINQDLDCTGVCAPFDGAAG